jgi:methylmalonyl-CoA mutase N-terminal domain/subunit
MVKAVEQRYPQGEIEQASYDYQQGIERGERIIVGVNRYQTEERARPDTLAISQEAARRQIARLEHVRKTRDGNVVAQALDALEEGARGDANLMPVILDAVQAYATIGEICDRLRRVFGEYREGTV